MSPWKAPGNDGFQAGFYQLFWEELGHHVCKFVKDVFNGAELGEDVNMTILVLIPKINNPQLFSHLRPISLCTVLYKMITKVIANRLKPVMNQFVLPNQSSFVPSRHISDNILIAQEIMHSMRIKKGKTR